MERTVDLGDPEELRRVERIEEIARVSKPRVMAVGIGGGGCNILSWIKERGVSGGKLISVNTDANHLSYCKADSRILIGEKITRGLGCGGYPKLGEKAMEENMGEVFEEISDGNIIFLVAGMGGGTGTGGIVALADELRRQFPEGSPHLIIGVVTLPFEIETARMEVAIEAVQRLQMSADQCIIIDNNRLIQVAGNLPFADALGVANTMVGKFIKGVTETITCASLINIDYADLRAIMKGGGLGSLGVGEGKGEGKVESAVERAIAGRLLDTRIGYQKHEATGLLVHVSGGEDITLHEVHRAGELIKRVIPSEAKVVWGARVSKELTGKATVMTVLTGVESSFIKPRKRFGPFKVHHRKYMPW